MSYRTGVWSTSYTLEKARHKESASILRETTSAVAKGTTPRADIDRKNAPLGYRPPVHGRGFVSVADCTVRPIVSAQLDQRDGMNG